MNTSTRWAGIRIAVDGSEDAARAAGALLLSAGCAGLATDIGAHDEPTAVVGYLPDDDRLSASLRRIDAALAMLGALGITGVAGEPAVAMIDEEDWANAWKQYFKPIRIGRHIVVSPPWEEAHVESGDHLIVIDPGMAFGTGTHATTQLCLAALEDYVDRETTVRAADIGTGSGILAIAAKKLGASYVHATDTDPLAVKIARQNATVNGVELDIRDEPDWSRKFDLLVANILADTLIALSDDFAAAIRPGGVYIASGIIEEREPDVRARTETLGFDHVETRFQGEWACVVFRRT
jgi:ribosomal protein L11 methyltransferase